MYEPKAPDLIVVCSRISSTAWEGRVKVARAEEVVLKRILERVADEGVSQNEAIEMELPPSKRSWAIKFLTRYKKGGFEALIDRRLPRESKLDRHVAALIQTVRQADPNATAEKAWDALRAQRIKALPDRKTVLRQYRKVDDRRRYAEKKRRAKEVEVIELDRAGGQVLLAAEEETGLVEALTTTVDNYAEAAREESGGEEYVGDVAHRDKDGRFTKTYNRKRRRRRGEDVASYLRPAREKAEGRPLDWARFTKEKTKTLRYKTSMLAMMWMLVRGQGWDALREPGTETSVELTGFAYMPSTMAKYVSALAISGLGDALLETVGRRWHEVATSRWDENGPLSAIFVDNQVKEVWSSLFTKAGKVSHLSRVMPCISTTFAHTGAGTPVVLGVHSGSAPLAPALLETVEEVERTLDTEVKRVTVIDAEGCTFDVFSSFAKAGRAIVSRMKPSRMPELELRYERGSYYRPFREGDSLRVAKGTLHRKSTKESLEVGVLLVRRDGADKDTVLLTTGLKLGLSGRDLAELYFMRWPMQENTFKDWRSVGLGEHKGNSGSIVSNIAVVTKLEKLQARRETMAEDLEKITHEAGELERARMGFAHEARRAEVALEVKRRWLDELEAEGRGVGVKFAKAAADHLRALKESERIGAELAKVEQKAAKASSKKNSLTVKLNALEEKRKKLEPMVKIRELDVEQDKLLTAHKLAAAGLMTFALREYFPDTPMTTQTVIDRLLSLKGRRELTETTDHIVICANPRDTEMTERVGRACDHINARNLTRDGRRWTFAVEEREEISDTYDWLC